MKNIILFSIFTSLLTQTVLPDENELKGITEFTLEGKKISISPLKIDNTDGFQVKLDDKGTWMTPKVLSDRLFARSIDQVPDPVVQNAEIKKLNRIIELQNKKIAILEKKLADCQSKLPNE